MNLVCWNNAIQITKRNVIEDVPDDCKLWTDLITPEKISDLIGNRTAINEIQSFLREAKKNENRSSCLFVHGESGTGKSTSVSVISKEMGFKPVHTYADKPRTPVRLEGVVREAGIHGASGLVILDDFEIFLSETASLKLLSKFLRSMIKEKSSSRTLFIIISNSTHKLFGAIQDISTLVQFERLDRNDMQKIFNRVQLRVRGHSYIPPMAAFFASSSCAGTITQGVQQLQFMYDKNKEVKFVRPRKRRKKIDTPRSKISSGNNRDCITYLWSEMYTDKMLDHLTSDTFGRDRVVDRLMGFGKDKLDILSEQVYQEYPKRIATDSLVNINRADRISSAISLSDTNRIEVHEDGLFDGENKEKWSENDINFITGVTSSVLELKGFSAREIARTKKSRYKLTKFNGVGNPQDAYYRNIILNN